MWQDDTRFAKHWYSITLVNVHRYFAILNFVIWILPNKDNQAKYLICKITFISVIYDDEFMFYYRLYLFNLKKSYYITWALFVSRWTKISKYWSFIMHRLEYNIWQHFTNINCMLLYKEHYCVMDGLNYKTQTY